MWLKNHHKVLFAQIFSTGCVCLQKQELCLPYFYFQTIDAHNSPFFNKRFNTKSLIDKRVHTYKLRFSNN
jgi:hypothetical protein